MKAEIEFDVQDILFCKDSLRPSYYSMDTKLRKRCKAHQSCTAAS